MKSSRLLVAGATFGALWHALAWAQSPCSDWEHLDFWRLNAVAEVQRCFAAGQDVNTRGKRGRHHYTWQGHTKPERR